MRDPVRDEASYVDLASIDQLDLPPSAVGMKGDKKIKVWRRGVRVWR
jgi:hypothetical protein